MKKIFYLLSLLGFLKLSAQQAYEFVIIPNKVDDFKAEANPYNLNTSLRYFLTKQEIKTYTDAEAEKKLTYEDRCRGLKAILKNTSSLFKNKLTLHLVDCNNTTVWAKEGIGRSKEFQIGYTEALTQIMKDFKGLPINNTTQPSSAIVSNNPNIVSNTPIASSVISTPEPLPVIVEPHAYNPKNIYKNETYTVDILSQQNDYKIIILNHSLLGYKALQQIAYLSPSGLEGVYNAQFITPNGITYNGVANFDTNNLKIAIKTSENTQIINLKKE